MIVTIPHRNYWGAMGRVATDPATWHAFDWASHPRYLELVDFAANICFGAASDFYFQAEPNLRIQAPGEVAVPWHTDADFGHQADEWNVWVPLTWIIDDTQRVWLSDSDSDGSGPWAPKVQLGEALIFRGATVTHGNHPNATNKTRRSMDFRLIARECYVDTGARTVEYDMPMTVGRYWKER